MQSWRAGPYIIHHPAQCSSAEGVATGRNHGIVDEVASAAQGRWGTKQQRRRTPGSQAGLRGCCTLEGRCQGGRRTLGTRVHQPTGAYGRRVECAHQAASVQGPGAGAGSHCEEVSQGIQRGTHERGSLRMASSEGMAPALGGVTAACAASAGPGGSAWGSLPGSPTCRSPGLPMPALALAPSLRLKLNEKEHLQPPHAARAHTWCSPCTTSWQTPRPPAPASQPACHCLPGTKGQMHVPCRAVPSEGVPGNGMPAVRVQHGMLPAGVA